MEQRLMIDSQDPVIYSELPTGDNKHVIGFATLNAPKSLNALTLDMIQSLRAKLIDWKSRKDMAAIWIQGAGDKAFCAGGDIIKLYDAMKSGDTAGPQNFFEHEYSLDLSLHQMTKPLIVWGDGVVMGGGMGIMQGCKFRIVTEKSMIAMPEITIGLYPDVGASYFLQKSPKPFGLFVALTGARLGASDALKMNFADYAIESTQKDILIKELCSRSYKTSDQQNMMILTDLLLKFSQTDSDKMGESRLDQHAEWISKVFSQNNLSQIDADVRAYVTDDKWLSKSLASYKTGSPTSAALIFEQLKRSASWSLEDTFQTELYMSAHCALSGEFLEGVRALLIDKDNAPQWKRKTLSDVSQSDVDLHFTPPANTNLSLKWMI